MPKLTLKISQFYGHLAFGGIPMTLSMQISHLLKCPQHFVNKDIYI